MEIKLGALPQTGKARHQDYADQALAQNFIYERCPTATYKTNRENTEYTLLVSKTDFEQKLGGQTQVAAAARC